jgi:hypothetical protein
MLVCNFFLTEPHKIVRVSFDIAEQKIQDYSSRRQ